MKSIVRTEITNFQSHANTVAEFAPSGYLTVITGDSDSGKTSILRALRWVFYNQPQGTDFMRVGSTSAKVTVIMDDGWQVTRERTPSKNRYIVTHPMGDEQIYEGFGTNVPIEVQHVLGVAPVDIGDMDLKLNIAEQLDGPFLGNSIAASFRAKVLGKLAGTEDVDIANKQLGTDLYRHDQDLKSVKGQILSNMGQIEELGWVKGLGQTIAQLEVLAQTIKSKQEQLRGLKVLKVKFDELSGRIGRGTDYVSKYQDVDDAISVLGISATKLQQAMSFQRLKQSYTSLVRDAQDALLDFEFYHGLTEAEGYIYGTSDKIHMRNTLIDLQRKHDTTSKTILEHRQRLQSLQGVADVMLHLDKAGSSIPRVVELNRSKARFQAIQIDLNEAKETQSRLDDIDSATQITEEMSITLLKLARFKELKSTLMEIGQSKKLALETIEVAAQTLGEATKLYQKTLLETGVCPTCGADAHQFKLKEVI